MDSPFERPANPSPPPSSPSTPREDGEFVFPAPALPTSTLTRQSSISSTCDGYETDSQLGDDVPLTLASSASMESLPTDETAPILFAASMPRFGGAYGGKHSMLQLSLDRYLVPSRRYSTEENDENSDSEEDEKEWKRMRTEQVVSEDEEEMPTRNEASLIEDRLKEQREKSEDDDDLYEF